MDPPDIQANRAATHLAFTPSPIYPCNNVLFHQPRIELRSFRASARRFRHSAFIPSSRALNLSRTICFPTHQKCNSIRMLLGQGVANLVISGALFFVLVKSFGLGNEFKDSTAGSPYTNNVATKGEPPTENAFQNEGEDQDHDQEQQQQAKGKSSSATRPISDDISVSAAKNRAQQSDLLCPCQSGIRYPECCGKYHTQSLANASGDAQFMRFPETASGVLRARFSAFALGDVDYIIRTTSTSNEDYINPQEDKEGFTMWRYSIKKFCRKYGFVGLTILNEQYFDVISSQGLGDRLLNWMNEMITPSSKHFDSPASNTASNDYSSNRPSKRVARILFRANMLVDGVPVYFIEDAKFVREGPNWKYASGTLVSGSE